MVAALAKLFDCGIFCRILILLLVIRRMTYVVGTWCLFNTDLPGFHIAFSSPSCNLTFLKLGCSLQSSQRCFLSLITEKLLLNDDVLELSK